MTEKPPKDGAFVVLFSGSYENWREMKIFLGKRDSDGLYELLGGGFDLSDLNPSCAACREIEEETSGGIKLHREEIEYFCHMTQKLPLLYDNEKGHAFYFLKEVEEIDTILCVASHEHTDLSWHTLESILTLGEVEYKTATLRVLLVFLRYLSERKFYFGILGDEFSFLNFSF